MSNLFKFKSTVWEHIGEKASWYLLSVPIEHGEVIKFITSDTRKSFGSVKVKVTIGSSTWDSSLFPSAKTGLYVLLLNKKVRVAESISTGDTVHVKVTLQTIV
jgi:Domain of unknown function (DUF1905)